VVERSGIALKKQEKQVVVRVRHYGKGLPWHGESIEKKALGFGIAGMQERIRRLGAA
jgi:signal transduction histidine kinase